MNINEYKDCFLGGNIEILGPVLLRDILIMEKLVENSEIETNDGFELIPRIIKSRMTYEAFFQTEDRLCDQLSERKDMIYTLNVTDCRSEIVLKAAQEVGRMSLTGHPERMTRAITREFMTFMTTIVTAKEFGQLCLFINTPLLTCNMHFRNVLKSPDDNGIPHNAAVTQCRLWLSFEIRQRYDTNSERVG
ncbi:hypothetical protein GQR58_021414 [Nymphon striatum]|nr:hypothetical protein GQR58_021414 [Nymphon striatum]